MPYLKKLFRPFVQTFPYSEKKVKIGIIKVYDERGIPLKQTKPLYGGQAVIEGVMFGGRHFTVTAVRKKDGEMEFYRLSREQKPIFQKIKNIPLLRGIAAIIIATATGSKHLQFSSDLYESNWEKDMDDEAPKKETKKWTMALNAAIVGILSFLFAKFVFTLVPVFLAEFTRPIFPGDLTQIFIEGMFKLLLLLAYIHFISLTPLVKKVLQYHGAEHKVINAFENGLDLTVENVQSQSRLHYRCGSSFLLFTVIVGIFVYMFVPVHPLWLRVVNRIALIPVVLGLSFEMLQITNKLRTVPILKYLGYPGLWLQLLTTKEPSDDQVEVAIASFNELLRLEMMEEKRLKEQKIV